jgi:CYTH domain-containing protein
LPRWTCSRIGPVLVEVEFARAEQARAFVAPAWFGRDVSEDPAYKNRILAS